MLAQEVEKVERAIYYISKKFIQYETKYSTLEKTSLELVWETKKLRHHMLPHTTHVISQQNPIKYLFEQPPIQGRISKWLVMLAEFELKYIPEKSMKGKVISDFLAQHPIQTSHAETTHLPDEEILMTQDDKWVMYFDGASNKKGCGVGVLLISPEGAHTPISVKLDFEVTNNAAECEACIIGLEAAASIGVQKLEVYGDSSLIINHILKKWKIKNSTMILYQAHLEQLIEHFEHIDFKYLPRMTINLPMR